MRKTLVFLFDKWWRPVLFVIVIIILDSINKSELNILFLYKPLEYLLSISLVILLISLFYQLKQGRGAEAIKTFICFFAICIFNFLFVLVDGDHWADDLKIPNNISLDTPISKGSYFRPDSIFSLIKKKPDLKLYNGMQPGIYEYDFWYGNIESGMIYLKAFEITRNEILSPSDLEQRTRIPIHNPSDSIIRFSPLNNNDFTIYEGDWGKFYAARFEVWFKPTGSKQERKIFEKNFIIEGWIH